MKIENRSICSEVISVKLFCREKGFKNVLYFYFILLFFANKLLCLCQCIFFQSDFYFPTVCPYYIDIPTTRGRGESVLYLTTWWCHTHRHTMSCSLSVSGNFRLK